MPPILKILSVIIVFWCIFTNKITPEAAVTYSKSGTNIKGKKCLKNGAKDTLGFSTTYHRK